MRKKQWKHFFIVGLAILACMWWSKVDLNFRVTRFALNTEHFGRVEGCAVLPKGIEQCPVIIYAHGSGSTLMTSGTVLRQFEELGFAAIDLEYSQQNKEEFAEQYKELVKYIRQQRWASANKIAWVGMSLGAQRQLWLLTSHPEFDPQLLVRVSGGLIDNSSVDLLSSIKCPVLLVNGQNDDIFPVGEVARLASLLKEARVSVTSKMVVGSSHTFDQNFSLIIRLIAERCNAIFYFQPRNSRYYSYSSGRGTVISFLLLFVSLTLTWVCLKGAWVVLENDTKYTRSIRLAAAAFCVFMTFESFLYFMIHICNVSNNSITAARCMFLDNNIILQCEGLNVEGRMQNQRLASLLDYIKLADYARESCSKWKLDDALYDQFVLSPYIQQNRSPTLAWRRNLWEFLSPRIKEDTNPDMAASTIVRCLRERVTVSFKSSRSNNLDDIWLNQYSDEQGFEELYIAALRTMNIAARLNEEGRAVLWTGTEWKNAPRPLLMSL